MERYGGIIQATFDQTVLSLPTELRLWRTAAPLPARGDGEAFSTSLQLAGPSIGAEISLRDTAVAEELSLGQAGELSVELAPTRAGQSGRVVSIRQAVLTGIELHYQQVSTAMAKLTFHAQAVEGSADPFSAVEVQP